MNAFEGLTLAQVRMSDHDPAPLSMTISTVRPCYSELTLNNPTPSLPDKVTCQTNLHGHCVSVTDNTTVALVQQKPARQMRLE